MIEDKASATKIKNAKIKSWLNHFFSLEEQFTFVKFKMILTRKTLLLKVESIAKNITLPNADVNSCKTRIKIK